MLCNKSHSIYNNRNLFLIICLQLHILTNSSFYVPEKDVFHITKKLHKNNKTHTVDNHTRKKTGQNYAKVCVYIQKYILPKTEFPMTQKYRWAHRGYQMITDLLYEIKQQLFLCLIYYLGKLELDHSLSFIMHCNYTAFLFKNMNN